jgi:hypothetical protein
MIAFLQSSRSPVFLDSNGSIIGTNETADSSRQGCPGTSESGKNPEPVRTRGGSTGFLSWYSRRTDRRLFQTNDYPLLGVILFGIACGFAHMRILIVLEKPTCLAVCSCQSISSIDLANRSRQTPANPCGFAARPSRLLGNICGETLRSGPPGSRRRRSPGRLPTAGLTPVRLTAARSPGLPSRSPN